MLTTEEWIDHHELGSSDIDHCGSFCPDLEIKGNINGCKAFLNEYDSSNRSFNDIVCDTIEAIKHPPKPKRKRGRPKKIKSSQKKRGRPKKF